MVHWKVAVIVVCTELVSCIYICPMMIMNNLEEEEKMQ